MNAATHVHYELLRSARNRLTWALSLALPLVVYYAVASGQRHAFVYAAGVSFPLYFMTGMAAYGAMFAAIGPGARLARDRARGWTRQLRITPLRVRTDYLAKTLAAYLVVLPALVLVFLAGVTLGVRLNVAQWLEMSGLLLVGLVPFVLMGLILGHLIATDALVPAMGWLTVFFALFGGALGACSTAERCWPSSRGCPPTGSCMPARPRSSWGLAGRGMGRARLLDRRAHPTRRLRLPARHRPGLIARPHRYL